jgi:hypothetical protein
MPTCDSQRLLSRKQRVCQFCDAQKNTRKLSLKTCIKLMYHENQYYVLGFGSEPIAWVTLLCTNLFAQVIHTMYFCYMLVL